MYSHTRALIHKLTQLILVAIGAGTEGPIAGWLSKRLDRGWGEGSSPAEVSALVLQLCPPPSPSALQSWAPHCHLWGGGHPKVCRAEPGEAGREQRAEVRLQRVLAVGGVGGGNAGEQRVHQLDYGGGGGIYFWWVVVFFWCFIKNGKKKLSYKHSGASSPPPTPGRQTPVEWQGKVSPPGGMGGAKAGVLWLQEGELVPGARHMTLSTTTTLLLSDTGVRVVRPLTSES